MADNFFKGLTIFFAGLTLYLFMRCLLKENNNDANLQLSFFDIEDPKMQEIKKIIKDLDIDNLSPVEALLKLNQIKKEINDED